MIKTFFQYFNCKLINFCYNDDSNKKYEEENELYIDVNSDIFS